LLLLKGEDIWKDIDFKYKGNLDIRLYNEFAELHPELSRDTGSGILDLIYKSEKNLKLKNSIDFAADSLFCEFAYVVNLDKDTLEIYKGFNEEPLNETERFYKLPSRVCSSGTLYYPVKFLISVPIKELTNDSMKEIDAKFFSD